jgi:hypothetical protein
VAITPFDEAPYVRTVAQPVSGGINTTAYDRFRQGVSIVTERDLVQGMFPKMKPANQLTPTGLQESTVFGQPSKFDISKPYEDIEKFNPVQFINAAGTAKIYPDVGADSSFTGQDTMDGVIEPLVIRKAAALATLEGRYYAHRIIGSWQSGNDDSYDASSSQVQIYNYKAPAKVVPFIDYPEYMGSTIGGSINIPGIISQTRTEIFPFTDRDFRARVYLDSPISVISGSDMINAVLGMSGSFSVMLGSDMVSATAGFIYGNTPYGTDSVAFGGLKK